MEIPPAEIPADGDVTVSCKIQNTGDRADDQVARLYFRQETSSVKINKQNLCGFERVHLLPGETKTATFKLTLGSSSEDARLSGGFEVMPGRNEHHNWPFGYIDDFLHLGELQGL